MSQGSSARAPAPATKAKPAPYPFWLGGVAASIAALGTHPLDVAKTRMQTARERPGLAASFVNAAKTEGIVGLYTGLSASIFRQMTYSVVRFGAYDAIKARTKPTVTYDKTTGKPSERMPGWKLACIASVAGVAGGIAGNPADIILVRMTSDINKEPAQRYRYRNALQGLYRMVTEEGVAALFRGVAPNCVRALLMNTSQIATYDLAKDGLLKTGFFKEGTWLHFSASFIAGTVATTVCSPADVVKARVMSASSNGGGGASMLTKLNRAIQKEGVGFLFRGWTPAWVRLSPNTILIFVTLEKLRVLVDVSREKRGVPSARTASSS